jgi:small-conductance mechanosensitive channel
LSDATIDTRRYAQSEFRISFLTLVLGFVGALPSAYFRGWRWGLGILIGAVLAWINFRWLKQGLNALTDAATAQADQPQARVPILTYFKATFRYGLIALSVYVIFKSLNVPVLSMIFGLCALGAATLAVSVLELIHSPD